MKNRRWAILLGLVLFASCVIYVPRGTEEDYPPPREEPYAEPDYRDLPSDLDTSYFYDRLSPYGPWVHHHAYGYVWIPRGIGNRWRPYTYGRWILTNYGWTWVSYYDWGWIPFHYGRWGWDTRLGWFWVPGTIWAPAWVTWRWGNLYVGWAPLPPDVEFVAGVGIGDLPFDFPDRYWIFCEGRYFQYDYLDRYVLPYERNATIVRQTVRKANLAVRNRQLFNDGIDVDQVRRITQREVSRYELEESSRPGQSRIVGRSVQVFRPVIKKSGTAAPKSFLKEDEVEEKIPEIRAGDQDRRISEVELERRLREDQESEVRLLEQSQDREKTELRRKTEDEKKLASTAAEKEKVEKEAEVKASRMRKEHEEEKVKISERHKEEEKVVKGRIKKKEKD